MVQLMISMFDIVRLMIGPIFKTLGHNQFIYGMEDIIRR